MKQVLVFTLISLFFLTGCNKESAENAEECCREATLPLKLKLADTGLNYTFNAIGWSSYADSVRISTFIDREYFCTKDTASIFCTFTAYAQDTFISELAFMIVLPHGANPEKKVAAVITWNEEEDDLGSILGSFEP